MASLNNVQLIGRLGADPEIKSFQSGDKVANLRLATSESWKDKDSGEKKENTEWHNVAIFGDGLVGVVERFTKKGSQIFVEGQLRTRKWQDNNGNDRYTTEVVLRPFAGRLILLGDPGQAGGQGAQGGRSQGGQGQGGGNSSQGGFGGGASRGGFGSDLDDDVPF